jgi:MFS family permease
VERGDRRAAWLVVAASTVGLFFHFGSLLVNAFGVMLTTLAGELQWSRGEVSFGFTLATLTAMLTMPLTGWLADRVGSRIPTLACVAAFGLLYGSLTLLTPRLWHFYALMLALGMVGPGTSMVTHASLISRWFTGRRGLALGVAMCGTAFGGVVWPSATQGLLDTVGWRNTYLVSGGGVLLVALPLLFLWLREPADRAIGSARGESDTPVSGLTRGEALRSGMLWLMLIAFFVISMSIHACMIHLVPMLTDRGMTATSAALAGSLMGAAGMAGRLGTGYLLDLVPVQRVPAAAFGLVACGIFLLFGGATGAGAHVAALLVGFGYGAESAAIPYLVSRYFGLRAFAELYSYLFVTVPLGGALGPVLMGVGFDRFGSYQLALLLCGVATIAAALALLRLGTPPDFGSRQPPR